MTKILQRWILGTGKPQTWRVLVETLRDCKLNVLADQIQTKYPSGSSLFRCRKKPFKTSAPTTVAMPDSRVDSGPVQHAPVHPSANTAVGQSFPHHLSTETHDLASHKSQISSSSGVAQSASENPPQTDHYSSVQVQRTGDGPPLCPHISLPAQQREDGPLQHKTSQPVTSLRDQSRQTQKMEDGEPSCRPAHGPHSSLQTQQEEGDPLRLKPTVQLTSPSGDTTSLQGRSDLLHDPSVHRTQPVTSPSKLEDEVSDKDLATIARDHLSNWESLRPYLELSHAQKEEIRRSCPGDYGKQKQECLEVWKQTKGNEATYRALITAAEDAKEQILADSIRNMLTSQKYVPLPQTHATHASLHKHKEILLPPLPSKTTQQLSFPSGGPTGLLACEGREELVDKPLQDKPRDVVTSVESTHALSQSGQLHPLLGQDSTPKPGVTVATELSQQVMSFGDQQQSLQPDKGSSYSIEEPSLDLLYKLNVPEQVGTHFQKFGTLLLEDKTGIKVDNIEDELHGRPERINRRILQYWLQGKGLPVTWETLIRTLRDCNLNGLADQIQTSLHS